MSNLIANITCYNCINNAICYLPDNNVGWCNKCNECRVESCNEKITKRIFWTVQLPCDNNLNFTLHKDICDIHAIIDHKCIVESNTAEGNTETIKNIKTEPYIYY